MAFAKKRALHDSMLSMIKNAVKTTTGMPRCRDKAATGETETTVWTQCEYQNKFKQAEGTHIKTRDSEPRKRETKKVTAAAVLSTEPKCGMTGGSSACWPGEYTQIRSAP